MPLGHHHSGLARSIAISACVLATAIALQGVLLFPRHLGKLFAPPRIQIRKFVACEPGQTAVAHVRYRKNSQAAPVRSLYKLDLKPSLFQAAAIPLDFSPWDAAVSASGRLFLTSEPGDVYSLDLFSSSAKPQFLGIHPLGGVLIMEVAQGGSIALTASYGTTLAWRFGEAGCLWHRSDLNVRSACFVGSGRLFCGLDSGQVVELNARSGTTLKVFDPDCGSVVSLASSDQANLIAALDMHGSCVVLNQAAGLPLWRIQLPMPAADPQFSPDGRLLLAPSDNRQPEVLILSAATGEHVKTLTGAQAEIACISIGQDGVARACDISSTITAWDLASGRLLYQYRLECLPASVSSS